MSRCLPLLVAAISGFAMFFSAWSMSYVYNENGRLASGLRYLETGDFSSFHVNPPLVSLVGAIPAAVGGASCPTRVELGIANFARDEYRAGRLFLTKNPNHRIFLFFGRLCCIVLVLAGLWTTFRFAAAAYGSVSGLVFLLLSAFSPFTLGYGALIVPDVSAAFWGAASVFSFWRWLRSPEVDAAFLAGCALGLAELTKFTLLIFYPLFVVMWAIYRIPPRSSDAELKRPSPLRRQALQLCMIFGLSLILINVGYAFEGTGKQLRTFKFQTTLFTGYKKLADVPAAGDNRFSEKGNIVEKTLGLLPTPLPANFVQGIDTQRLDFERGLPSYWRGTWSDHGWLWYYLYAFLVKIPVGTLLLFLLAVFCSLALKGYNLPWRDEMVILLPGLVLLAFVSSQTGFSLHSRYALPALPFFFLWTSKVGRAFRNVRRRDPNESGKRLERPQGYRTVRVLTIVLTAWSTLSVLSVYPNSISYFNELAAVIPTSGTERPKIPRVQKSHRLSSWYKTLVSAGPINGPRHLLDSNIDWGQDFFKLERWSQRRPEIKMINVAYQGSYPLELSKMPVQQFWGGAPKPGWYAVSVNCLYSREGEYRYLLDCEPVDMVGYSFYIYHLTKEDVAGINDSVDSFSPP